MIIKLYLITLYLLFLENNSQYNSDVKKCTENDIGKIIGPCLNDKKKSIKILNKKVFFFWKINCIEFDIKLPNSLEVICDLKCHKGFYLNINSNKDASYNCEQCKGNTFSKGGDIHLAGRSNFMKNFLMI